MVTDSLSHIYNFIFLLFVICLYCLRRIFEDFPRRIPIVFNYEWVMAGFTSLFLYLDIFLAFFLADSLSIHSILFKLLPTSYKFLF